MNFVMGMIVLRKNILVDFVLKFMWEIWFPTNETTFQTTIIFDVVLRRPFNTFLRNINRLNSASYRVLIRKSYWLILFQVLLFFRSN